MTKTTHRYCFPGFIELPNGDFVGLNTVTLAQLNEALPIERDRRRYAMLKRLVKIAKEAAPIPVDVPVFRHLFDRGLVENPNPLCRPCE